MGSKGLSWLLQALGLLSERPLIFEVLVGAAPLFLVALLAFSRRRSPDARLFIWSAFALGLLATLPVTLLAMPRTLLASGGLWDTARSAFVDAAIPEESCKLLVLLWLTRRVRAHRPGELLVGGFVVGLGFAAMENVLFLARGADGLLFRTLATTPCHAFLGVVMAGYLARYSVEKKLGSLLKAWLVPLFLHGLYDFPLMAPGQGRTELLISHALLAALILALLAAWARFLFAAFARIKPVELGAVSERKLA